ncbi:MAG: TIGR04076 family protein [Actinobacteria bacterium]|nr:TIGR04076 family protein [Actinomycetota bacterium]
MSKGPTVRMTITEIMGKGTCPFKLKVGDTWEVRGEAVPEHFCGWAFQSIFPFLTVLRFNGVFPWGGEGNKVSVCCPDPANPVVFELERIEE